MLRLKNTIGSEVRSSPYSTMRLYEPGSRYTIDTRLTYDSSIRTAHSRHTTTNFRTRRSDSRIRICPTRRSYSALSRTCPTFSKYCISLVNGKSIAQTPFDQELTHFALTGGYHGESNTLPYERQLVIAHYTTLSRPNYMPRIQLQLALA